MSLEKRKTKAVPLEYGSQPQGGQEVALQGMELGREQSSKPWGKCA